MGDCIELELKLEFDPRDRHRLEAAMGPKPAGRSKHLVSTYFDTPGKDLLKAGYTLRVRQNGERYEQSVKEKGRAGAGLFERSEWQQPLAGPQPQFDGRSGPIVEALGAGKLRRIRPVFVTDVRRRTFRISGPDSGVEIALDHGLVRAGEWIEALDELELEHRDGAVAPLFDLARRLNEQVPLRLGVRSKSERGYTLGTEAGYLAQKAEPLALDRRGDASGAFSAIAQACIRHFRLNEAVVSRTGDAEALHQARVALRRLRSAFSIFKSLFGDDARLQMLAAELRWLATELGDVRNIDVLIGHADGNASELLGAARTTSLSRAQADLASARTRLLMIDLVEWLAIGEWRSAPAHSHRARANVRHFARAQLETLRNRLKRDGQGLADLDDRHCHRVRIEAKKLRYAAEFFASLYVSDKAQRRHRRFVAALETLQETLGASNDLVVGKRLAAQHGVDIPTKKRRKRLHVDAEAAFDALMRTRRFW